MLSFSDKVAEVGSNLLADSFEEQLRYHAHQNGFVAYGGKVSLYPTHRHRELEMNLVRQGTARYLLGDRRYDLSPGSMVWLFPAQDHVLLEWSPDYEDWIVVWRPEAVAQTCQSETHALLRTANPEGNFCRRLGAERLNRLHHLFGEIEAARQAGNHDHHNATLAYALTLSWEFYSHADDAPTGTDIHPAVEAAVRLLREGEDANDLTIDALGRAVGLSGAHLSRLFQAQTGQSIVAFRNRERIQRYLTLFGGGNRLTMLQAAMEAGFGSYAQFHRVFVDRMGVGPLEYHRR